MSAADSSGGPGPGTSAGAAPAVDPGVMLRSRSYRALLVFAAVIGIVVSIAGWGFLELLHLIQQWVYVDSPSGLGFESVPWWWPVPVLAVAGVIIALAVARLPGHGGHIPAEGLKTGPPTTPVELPGVLLAALASIGLGLVLGPEALLIALGTGLALLAVQRSRRPVPDQPGWSWPPRAALPPWPRSSAHRWWGRSSSSRPPGWAGRPCRWSCSPGCWPPGSVPCLCRGGVGDRAQLQRLCHQSLVAAGLPTPQPRRFLLDDRDVGGCRAVTFAIMELDDAPIGWSSGGSWS